MKLLVSVVGSEEALEALKGGAHILDVKNPREGSLGANFPWVISRVREIATGTVEVSATLGDLPNIPGTASLAALGAVSSGAEYVKVGLFGTETVDEAVFMVKSVCRAVKNYDPSAKVIAGGYADSDRIGSLNPLDLPLVASRSGADGVIIDIKVKGVEKLFDLLGVDELGDFVAESHRHGLIAALAGSLTKEDLVKVWRLGADIFGTRKSICEGGDRFEGRVHSSLVREMVDIIDSLNE